MIVPETIDIHDIMEALKEMPLPEKIYGWNQIVLMVFKKKDGQKITYEWIFNNNLWKIVEGQPQQPTLICEDYEENFIQRILDKNYSITAGVMTPSGLSAAFRDTIKFGTLYNGFALSYLRNRFSNRFDEVNEARKAIEIKERERIAQVQAEQAKKKIEQIKSENEMHKCPSCNEHDSDMISRTRKSYLEIIGTIFVGGFAIFGFFFMNSKYWANVDLTDIGGIVKFLWLIKIILLVVGLVSLWEGITGVGVPFLGFKLWKEKQSLHMKCNKCNHEWTTVNH